MFPSLEDCKKKHDEILAEIKAAHNKVIELSCAKATSETEAKQKFFDSRPAIFQEAIKEEGGFDSINVHPVSDADEVAIVE